MRDFDYSKVKHYKFYRFATTVFGPMFKALYHLKYKQTENIPTDTKRYIVAINHTCALDPVFVALADGIPALHFMAKMELFKNPVVAWVITHLYGFPVRRGQGDNTSLDFAKRIVEENHVMAICPEGKRIKDKDGVPQKAKPGVTMIAKETGAMILPVAICAKETIKRGVPVTVVFGKPMTPEELELDKCTEREDFKEAANKVMAAITEMRERELSED